LRDRLLVKNVIEGRKVRLIGVRGCVTVWNEGRGATNAIELEFKESKTRQSGVRSGLTCRRYLGWDTLNRECTEYLDSPVKPSVWAEEQALESNFTSTPGSLWLLPPLATWTIPKSPPTASGLYLVKNAYAMGVGMSTLERSSDLALPHLEVSVVSILVQVSRDTQ